MHHSIPLFEEKNRSRLREEKRGYLSFHVADGNGRAMPWIINKTGAELLSLCDGSHDVSQIVSLFADKYRRIPKHRLQDNIVRILGNLTRIGCIVWKCEKERKLVLKGKRIIAVTENLLPHIQGFMKFRDKGNGQAPHIIYELDDILVNNPMAMGGRRCPEKSYVSFNDAGGIESILSVARIRDSSWRIYLLTRLICISKGIHFSLSDILKRCALEDSIGSQDSMQNVAARVICMKDSSADNVMREMLAKAGGAFSLGFLRCECRYNDVAIYELPLTG